MFRKKLLSLVGKAGAVSSCGLKADSGGRASWAVERARAIAWSVGRSTVYLENFQKFSVTDSLGKCV